MELKFDEKVVLVTGATSGIGEACARLFANAGADLIITGRNEDKLNKLQAGITSGSKIMAITGNMTDENFRERLIRQTVHHYKKLDVLVNAAGIIANGTIENTPLSQFDELMDVNLRSIFHLMQLSIPHLEKTGGNIINVSSVAGVRSFPGILSYCVSKAALDQLTRCAALEVAAKGIRVNAVNPGVVKTQLHTRSVMDTQGYQKFLEHSKTTHPLGRYGQPGEIAGLIAYLASDLAGWITGVTYSIDGGRALTCLR